MTLTKILRDNGLAARATVHGFRSAFRDWCAETGAPREVAEAALAHTVGGVEGAYFRSDLFERRRALMESWGSFWPARHELRTLGPMVAASSISTPAATDSRMSGSAADHRRLLRATLGQGCGAPRGSGRTVRQEGGQMSIPTDSGRRNAARGRERGRTRQLPVLPQDVLERPGLHVGPDFVGMDLDALRRVRRYANSLRGGLLKQSDARYRAPDERRQ